MFFGLCKKIYRNYKFMNLYWGDLRLKARAKTIYYQIAEDLKQQIMTGALTPGEMLPSQSQIAAAYGVALMTVRQGLGVLIDEGYIYSVPGKGYFVAEPNLDKLVIKVSGESFFGQKLNITMNHVDILAADRKLANKLGVAVGKTILQMQLTLHSAAGPVALDDRYVPYRKGEPLLEKELQYAYFPHIIARHTNMVVARSDFSVNAMPLSQAEADALQAPAGLWGLCIEQVLYDISGNSLGWSRLVGRSDRYTLSGAAHSYAGRL